MKKTWLQRTLRQLRGVKKYVKKSIELKRFVLTMTSVWMIIPVVAVQAASPILVPEQNVTTVVLDSSLIATDPKFTVEVKSSNYQLSQKELAKQKSAQIVKTRFVSTANVDQRTLAKQAAAAWNIDWRILEAVWQVESGKQIYTTVGSYAGARGPCQFMPGTWKAYAQDGNGDGVKDVFDARDCLYGAAKLLAVNGLASGNVDGALLRYNHSLSYVAKVKGIAYSIED